MRLHFLAVKFDDELITAGVRIPVNVAQVITRLVFAVILKIHRATGKATNPFTTLPVQRTLR